MRTTAPLLLIGAVVVACRSPNPVTAPAPAAAPPVAASASASAGPASDPAPAPAASGAAGTSTPATEGDPAGSTPPGESLPEIRVRNVGLHVGGGPNDAAPKAPYQAAIAARFADFRRCYALIGTPGKGGVFGVDLRIPREGGRATVQGSRTGLGGAPFRDCVLAVFSAVEFAPPSTGTTVISYSLEFTVGDG